MIDSSQSPSDLTKCHHESNRLVGRAFRQTVIHGTADWDPPHLICA